MMTDLEEFARKMEALTRLGIEVIGQTEDDQEQTQEDKRERTQTPLPYVPPANRHVIPLDAAKPAPPPLTPREQATERAGLEETKGITPRREAYRRAATDEAALMFLRKTHETDQGNDEEGKPKPVPLVGLKNDDMARPVYAFVVWPDGVEARDYGHKLALHAPPSLTDSAAVARLFDFADVLGVWLRWGEPKRAKRDEWDEWGGAYALGEYAAVGEIFAEAFHRCRPVLPRISLVNPVKQTQPAQWLAVMEATTEEAKAYGGTQRGDEAAKKARFMKQRFNILTR
jgi:hypothetical protein